MSRNPFGFSEGDVIQLCRSGKPPSLVRITRVYPELDGSFCYDIEPVTAAETSGDVGE